MTKDTKITTILGGQQKPERYRKLEDRLGDSAGPTHIQTAVCHALGRTPAPMSRADGTVLARLYNIQQSLSGQEPRKSPAQPRSRRNIVLPDKLQNSSPLRSHPALCYLTTTANPIDPYAPRDDAKLQNCKDPKKQKQQTEHMNAPRKRHAENVTAIQPRKMSPSSKLRHQIRADLSPTPPPTANTGYNLAPIPYPQANPKEKVAGWTVSSSVGPGQVSSDRKICPRSIEAPPLRRKKPCVSIH